MRMTVTCITSENSDSRVTQWLCLYKYQCNALIEGYQSHVHHHVCLNTCTQHTLTLTLTHSPVVMKILQTSSTFSSLSADRDVFTVYMFTSWARADSSGHWQPPAVHQSGHYWDVLLGVLCPGLEPCNWGGSGDGDDKQDVVTYLAVIRTKQTDKPTSLIHPYRSSR